MYRVIFLFAIDDVYNAVEVAVERMRTRRSDAGSTPDLIRNWFCYQLHQDLHLAVWQEVSDTWMDPSQFDQQFHEETYDCFSNLYQLLSLAIFNHARPCTEGWCRVHLDRRTLRLTFDVGPIDYGARLA